MRARRFLPTPLLAALLLALAPTGSGSATPTPDGAATTEETDPHNIEEPSWADRFRWAGEELHFTVEILGGEAARAALSIGPPIEHERWGRTVPIQGIAGSLGFFDRIYPMENDGMTFLDPETGLPFFAEKSIRERGNVRSYAVTYARHVFRADVRRVRDGRADSFRRFVPSDLHDGFSWIYDMRSRDLSVGHEFVYYIYDGWRLSRLTFRILSHEWIDSPIGSRHAAYFQVRRDVLDSSPLVPWAERTAVLPPVLHPTSSYVLGYGWLSLDEDRIPIGVQLDSPLGPIRMMIRRHVPAR
ncbi:MAG: DUF3108 domain-containing protein [Deltaproteobacteria bacterium]|nr:MAG: DUF3108 domain-containing protein [Deltaproteobacteria bacterium]